MRRSFGTFACLATLVAAAGRAPAAETAAPAKATVTAIVGATLEARRAGIHAARPLTIPSDTLASTNDMGS